MPVVRSLLLALVALAPLAGCLTVDDLPGSLADDGGSLDGASASPEARDVASPGEDDASMTAEETVAEEESLAPGVPPLYAATRVHTIEGDLALAALPAFLSTSVGDVTVGAGESGRWRLVATLEGRGLSAEDARRERDRLSFSWAHEDAGEHFAQGVVTVEDGPASIGPLALGAFTFGRATLALTVPPEVALALAVSTSSGDVTLEGVRGSAATLGTSSGDVAVAGVAFQSMDIHVSSGDVSVRDATVRLLSVGVSSGDVALDVAGVEDAMVQASSGDVAATLAPARDGSLVVGTSSGDVDVRVPEDATRGYDALASATSGDVSITLSDGRVASSEDGDEATFVTDGFARRDVRTRIALSATSGDVTLAPA